MKFSVLQENLARAVSVVGRFVSGKVQVPVLANFLIRGEEGEMVLAATNMDTGIEFLVGAKVEKGGGFTVPAKVFGELVDSLPQGKVKVELEKDYLGVKSGSFESKFQGVVAEEFPKFPKQQKVKQEKVEVLEVAEVLGRVGYAASNDETRPALTGIFFDLKGKKSLLAATDGYRLSVDGLKGYSGEGGEGFLVSARVLNEGVRVFKELGLEEMSVGLSVEQKQLFLTGERIKIVTRLLEGEFPAYRKIVPQKSEVVVEIDKEELLQAIRATAIFARESANIIRWTLNKKGLVVEANSPQVGENKVEVGVEFKKEGEGKIAFNSRYLIDFLSNVSGEKIEFGMNEALQPGLFREKGRKDFLHVIMPVRVQE